MLTDRQKQLIRETFVTVARREYSTGEMFYERLFEQDPSLKTMFPNEMRGMRLKFIQTIGSFIAALELGEDYHVVFEEIGKNHLDYGVKKEHYQTFGDAFLWAVQQVLGDRFTPEVKEAWQALYNTMTGIATEAAYANGVVEG